MESIYNTANVSQNVRDTLKANGIGLNNFIQILRTPGNKQSVREKYSSEYGLQQSKFIIICDQIESQYLKNSSSLLPKKPTPGLAQIQNSSFNKSQQQPQPQIQLKSGNKRLNMLLGSGAKIAAGQVNNTSKKPSPSMNTFNKPQGGVAVSSKIPQLIIGKQEKVENSLDKMVAVEKKISENTSNSIKSPPVAESTLRDLLRDTGTTMPESRQLTLEVAKHCSGLSSPPTVAPAHFEATFGAFSQSLDNLNGGCSTADLQTQVQPPLLSEETTQPHDQKTTHELKMTDEILQEGGVSQMVLHMVGKMGAEGAREEVQIKEHDKKDKEEEKMSYVRSREIEMESSNIQDFNVDTLSEEDMSYFSKNEAPYYQTEGQKDPSSLNKNIDNQVPDIQQRFIMIAEEDAVISHRYNHEDQQSFEESLPSESSSDSLSSSFTESQLNDKQDNQPLADQTLSDYQPDDNHSLSEHILIQEQHPAPVVPQVQIDLLNEDNQLLQEVKPQKFTYDIDQAISAMEAELNAMMEMSQSINSQFASPVMKKEVVNQEVQEQRSRDMACQCEPWVPAPQIVYKELPQKVMRNKKLQVTQEKINKNIQAPQKKESETQVKTQQKQYQESKESNSLESSPQKQTLSVHNLQQLNLPKIAQSQQTQQQLSYSGLPYLAHTHSSDPYETHSQRIEPLKSILKKKPSPSNQEENTVSMSFDDETFNEFSYFTQQYQPSLKRVKFDPLIVEKERAKMREQQRQRADLENEVQRKRDLKGIGKQRMCLYNDRNEFAPNAMVREEDRQRKRLRYQVQEWDGDDEDQDSQEQDDQEEFEAQMQSVEDEEGEEEYEEEVEEEVEEEAEEELQEDEEEDQEEVNESDEDIEVPKRPQQRYTVAMKEPRVRIQASHRQLRDDMEIMSDQHQRRQDDNMNCDKMQFKQRMMTFISQFKK